MYLTCNPEGVGLQWAREWFVIPDREGTIDGTRMRFVFSTYKDNKYTDPDYVLYLEDLPGALGKAWHEGDFDVFMGQAFANFREDLHVIEPFPIPSYWPVWVAVDDGHAEPFCALWFTRDPITRRIYVIMEAYQALLTNDVQARLIRDYTDRDWRIQKYIADPAMFIRTHRKENKALSAADIYKEEGIRLRRGENDRILGKRMVDYLLGPAEDGIPRMQIFDLCPNLISQLKNLVFDPNRPEDTDQSMEDHAYDPLRYGVLDKMSKKAMEYEPPQANRFTQSALDAWGDI